MKQDVIVWDLFGGSQNSVYNALKYFKGVKVYTFDNNPLKTHDNQFIVDLSNMEEFNQLVKANNIPNPDLIFASPLCTSFSLLQNYGNERVCWTKLNNKWILRDFNTVTDILSKSKFWAHYNPKKYYDGGVLGKVLLDNTIQIIKQYQPVAFYIENPQTSLMWDVINLNHHNFYNQQLYLALAHYNSYDLTFSKKPTYFLSNYPLSLKHYNITNNIKIPKGARMKGTSKNETGERVKIPALLIIDIYKQLIKD